MANSGGGLCNDTAGGGEIVVTNCALTGNMATTGDDGRGGGIYNSNADSGTIMVTDCTLSGNMASNSNKSGYGGGIFNFNYNGGMVTVSNCTLSNNIAYSGDQGYGTYTGGYGGGIYNIASYGGTLSVTNCTLSGNNANGGSGGGIYNATIDFHVTLTNDILYGDTDGNNGADREIAEGGNTTANYCDIQRNYPGEGTIIPGIYPGTANFDADPLFVSGTSPYDLHLQPGSPCIGAGTASGAPATDITGTMRPNPPSIGAYELAPVPPPTNLTATAGPGKVSLAWTAPSGASSPTYSLYRGTTLGGETLYKSGITATTFVNNTVTVGTKYYYTVMAVLGGQSSAASNEASATPTGAAVPAAPTNLKAAAGDTRVTLTWTAPTGVVTSYTLYRGTSASALTVYKSGLTATSFANGLVTNGTTYYYAVAAVNSAGTGPKSGIVSATPIAAPGAPTGLTATASGGKITLTWAAPAGTVTGYNLYRGTASGGETLYKSTANTSFVNATVTKGTTYFYTVKAVNGSGTSPASNEAMATP